MNKRIISAVSAAVVFFSAAASACAYTLYSEGKCAASVSEGYTPELTRLNSELYEAVKTYSLTSSETAEQSEAIPQCSAEETGSSEEQSEPQPPEEASDTAAIYTELLAIAQQYHDETAKTGRELAGKLMDYDVALKRLKILIGRYESRRDNAEKLERLVLTGESDTKTAQSARDEADDIYFDIKALLFDISVMKSDIESITGETLKDDFDFNGVYLITDALKLNCEAFTDLSQLGSLYVPEGIEPSKYEASDCTAPLNASVQAYYALGAAMRDYVTAAAAEKEGESGLLLDEMTPDELQKLTEAREDCFLAAAEAKVEFSKALLALDEASGRSVSGTLISGQEADVLSSTLPESVQGTGMWLVLRTSGGIGFLPVSSPEGTYPINEEDTALYSYTLSYNGQKIGSAGCGSICQMTGFSYKDGVNHAEAEFFRNGVSVGTYRVYIFTPYGRFE